LRPPVAGSRGGVAKGAPEPRVRHTGANWLVYNGFQSYKWVSVPICTGVYQSGFKYFEFEFEKLKNETKIPESTSRFIESNIVKFPNLVHLVFFYHYNISQNRKRTPAH
jgi:hypothetical protein